MMTGTARPRYCESAKCCRRSVNGVAYGRVVDRTVLATGSARARGADADPVEPVEAVQTGDPVVVERPSRNERVAGRMGLRPTAGVDEPYLDGLRAVAVILVVVLHSHISAGNPRFAVFGHDISFVAVTGGVGVDLFFILSGFLLARPWFAAELTGSPRPGLKRFWTRRFLRVAPAYYVSIVVVLVFFVPNQIPPASATGRGGPGERGVAPAVRSPVRPAGEPALQRGQRRLLDAHHGDDVLPAAAVRAPAVHRAAMAVTLPAALVATFTWLYLPNFAGSAGRPHAAAASARAASPVVGVPNNGDYMRALLTTEFPTWLFTFALGIGLARMVVVHAVRPARPNGGGSGPVSRALARSRRSPVAGDDAPDRPDRARSGPRPDLEGLPEGGPGHRSRWR